jgi:hypothetical protein
MSTQYRLVQSRKTASGGCSAGPRFVRACSTTDSSSSSYYYYIIARATVSVLIAVHCKRFLWFFDFYKMVLSPQKFERLPFSNGCRYSIENYGVEVIFNGMTSLLNFIQICNLIQKLMGGRQTDTQTGW